METPRTDSALVALALRFAQAAVEAGGVIMDVYARGPKMRAKADASAARAAGLQVWTVGEG